ncbi:hypothetical protein ACH5Y9_03440 [Methylomonas sp. BW4-1]|uniref:hypothetical protein n=1 Tax=Methylomonas sp. BW4-1 TaxID=3376685 RepID=UPI00404258CD
MSTRQTPPPKATPEDLVKVSATYAAFGIQQNQDQQPALNFQWSKDALKIITDAYHHTQSSCMMDIWIKRYDAASCQHLASTIINLIAALNSKIQYLTHVDSLNKAKDTLSDIEQIIRHVSELRDLIIRSGDTVPYPGGFPSRINHRLNPTTKLIKHLREFISSTYGASI